MSELRWSSEAQAESSSINLKLASPITTNKDFFEEDRKCPYLESRTSYQCLVGRFGQPMVFYSLRCQHVVKLGGIPANISVLAPKTGPTKVSGVPAIISLLSGGQPPRNLGCPPAHKALSYAT